MKRSPLRAERLEADVQNFSEPEDQANHTCSNELACFCIYDEHRESNKSLEIIVLNTTWWSMSGHPRSNSAEGLTRPLFIGMSKMMLTELVSV